MLKGKVKYAIQPPITLGQHAWPPRGISGVGTKLLLLFLPFHRLSLSLSGLTAAHFFIAELVDVILPLALGDFHVRNNSVLFLPQTQRVLNARAAKKTR